MTERLLISQGWEGGKDSGIYAFDERMKTNTRAVWAFFFSSSRRGSFLWFFFFLTLPPFSTSSPSSFSLSHSPSIFASQQPSQLQVIRLTTVLWHTKSDDKLIAPPWWKEQRKDGRWWALIRNFGKSIPLQPWALHANVLPLARFFFPPSFFLSLRFSRSPSLVPSFKSRRPAQP